MQGHVVAHSEAASTSRSGECTLSSIDTQGPGTRLVVGGQGLEIPSPFWYDDLGLGARSPRNLKHHLFTSAHTQHSLLLLLHASIPCRRVAVQFTLVTAGTSWTCYSGNAGEVCLRSLHPLSAIRGSATDLRRLPNTSTLPRTPHTPLLHDTCARHRHCHCAAPL
jgi:hypothetical protein